jgi:hypothetical protein
LLAVAVQVNEGEELHVVGFGFVAGPVGEGLGFASLPWFFAGVGLGARVGTAGTGVAVPMEVEAAV